MGKPPTEIVVPASSKDALEAFIKARKVKFVRVMPLPPKKPKKD